MHKLELEHIVPYLPYKLMCEYEGIINGKELSKQNKQYEADGLPFYFSIEPVKGPKIAPIKELRIFKNYWKVYIGNYRIGLKSFVNGHEFKPLLIPLSEFNDSEADTEIFNTGKAYTSVKLNQPSQFPYWQFEILVKHHFDVFGLINAGLAISKLTNLSHA